MMMNLHPWNKFSCELQAVEHRTVNRVAANNTFEIGAVSCTAGSFMLTESSVLCDYISCEITNLGLLLNLMPFNKDDTIVNKRLLKLIKMPRIVKLEHLHAETQSIEQQLNEMLYQVFEVRGIEEV